MNVSKGFRIALLVVAGILVYFSARALMGPSMDYWKIGYGIIGLGAVVSCIELVKDKKNKKQ